MQQAAIATTAPELIALVRVTTSEFRFGGHGSGWLYLARPEMSPGYINIR